MNKCAYENRAKTQESLDYATNNPMVDKNEQRRKRRETKTERIFPQEQIFYRKKYIHDGQRPSNTDRP